MKELMTDFDRKIYEEEFAHTLPGKIFDAHVHIFPKSVFPESFSFKPTSCYMRFDGEFPLELWKKSMKELLPLQEVHVNAFGIPNDAANRDIIPETDGKSVFSGVITSPADPVELLAKRVEESHATTIKPYLDFAASFYGKKPNDVEVKDMLTKEQLEYINKKKLAITWHIPRSGRFADPLNQKQMIELCEKYPDITFIFAHIGRAYFMKNIRESNLREFSRYPNAFFDTAMLNSPEIIRYTCDHFPAERLLFGTDSPIALLRGKSIEVNHQYAYLMGENYKIGTAVVDTSGTIKFTFFFYEQLRGILEGVPEKDQEKVFYTNAQNIFERIYKQ